MITIYSEISEVSTSKAQQSSEHAKVYNEFYQLEVKKLIDKDFSCVKNIDWYNALKERETRNK